MVGLGTAAASARNRGVYVSSVHNGDLASADNRQSINDGTIADGILDDFFAMQSAGYAATVPTLFSVGNHKLQLSDIPTCNNGQECRGLAYVQRVGPTLPVAASGSSSPFFYSVNQGAVHIISISFESSWEAGSAQAL